MSQVTKSAKTLFWVYVVVLACLCAWQRSVLFAWPAGIVTGNLLASAIWAPLAVIHLDNLAVKHHKAHMNLMRAQHDEHMAMLRGNPDA